MILKETLKEIVHSKKEILKSQEIGVKREILKKIDLALPTATILSGVRRCGKSTLLRQLMSQQKQAYYFNFEEPKALNFEVNDFEKLNEAFKEEYGKYIYYFLDEIQNVKEWERFVRSKLDEGKKFVITGSNASLLSKELGTKLTGRHISYELFPFSYKEALKLKNLKPGIESFNYYFEKGGFPDFLKYEKPELLEELFNDILNRDIIVRYNLRDSAIIKNIAVYLLSNIGKEFSYNSLKKLFNLGSVNTVISYISYFEDSYLIFTIPKFDYSFRKQIISPKKVYSIDLGLSKAVSASFSSDKGRMLENIVFLALRRRYKNLFYFKNKGECDFIVKEKDKATQAIQVCYELTEDDKEREINGLKEAMKTLHIKEGIILTLRQEDKFGEINVLPVWKWLCS